MDEWKNDVYCEHCRRKIMPCETYVNVLDINVCEDCYEGMSEREFIEKVLGGMFLMKE